MLSASAAALLKLVHHHKPELIKIMDSINLPMSLQRCSSQKHNIKESNRKWRNSFPDLLGLRVSQGYWVAVWEMLPVTKTQTTTQHV